MSEVTLRHMKVSGSPTVTLGVTKWIDSLTKAITPVVAGKSTNNRTSVSSKKVVDLNRTKRTIKIDAKLGGQTDPTTDYVNLKNIRARGGTCRLTYTDEIGSTDPDWDSTRSCINITIEQMDFIITAQDRVDSNDVQIVYDVTLSGIVAIADEN